MYNTVSLYFLRRLNHNLTLSKRYAGHSKWANIKHIKAQKDHQKSVIFHKMTRLMRLAIQEGGSADPNSNSRLADIIEQAKKYNMPVASIQNTIKQSKESKGSAKSAHFEIRGPGGCIIIVTALTDNYPRMKASINAAVRRSNSSFIEGAVPGLFDHKGVIEAIPPDQTALETAVEHAIEVGAEDVVEVDSEESAVFRFICEPILLNQVKGKLEKLSYKIKVSESEFIPHRQIVLSDADLEAVRKMYEKLEDDPDIVSLHDNIA